MNSSSWLSIFFKFSTHLDHFLSRFLNFPPFLVQFFKIHLVLAFPHDAESRFGFVLVFRIMRKCDLDSFWSSALCGESIWIHFDLPHHAESRFGIDFISASCGIVFLSLFSFRLARVRIYLNLISLLAHGPEFFIWVLDPQFNIHWTGLMFIDHYSPLDLSSFESSFDQFLKAKIDLKRLFGGSLYWKLSPWAWRSMTLRAISMIWSLHPFLVVWDQIRNLFGNARRIKKNGLESCMIGGAEREV